MSRQDGGACELDWSQAFSAPLNGPVYAMTIHDDGSGPALYIGGGFTASGTTPLGGVAKWSGTAWVSLGLGVNGSVREMTTWDPDAAGSEPAALVVAGSFTMAGGQSIVNLAVWSFDVWFPLSGWNNRPAHVYDLDAFDLDGAGSLPPSLIIATPDIQITGEAGVTGVIFWTVGQGLAGRRLVTHSTTGCSARATVHAIGTHDPDGPGPVERDIVVAGSWWREEFDGKFCNYAAGGSVATYRQTQPRGWVDVWNVGFTPYESVQDVAEFDLDNTGPNGPRLLALTRFPPQRLLSLHRTAPNTYQSAGIVPLPMGVGQLGQPVLRNLYGGAAGSQALLLASANDQFGGPNTLHQYSASADGPWSGIGPILAPPSESLAMLGFSDGVLVGGAFTASANQPLNFLGRLSCDAACPGDTNDDNVVNFIDLNAVLSFFGQSGAMLPGDLNADGVVNFLDLNEVLSYFGISC